MGCESEDKKVSKATQLLERLNSLVEEILGDKWKTLEEKCEDLRIITTPDNVRAVWTKIETVKNVDDSMDVEQPWTILMWDYLCKQCDSI
jgi:hypothetical protein